MPPLNITPGSETPIFRQIVDQIRGAIAGGRLAVGDPLPSVRALAAELVVNHNTVAKAYAQLVRDSLIESRRGTGYFVAKRRAIYTPAERRRRVRAMIEPMVAEALTLGLSADDVRELVEQQLHATTPPENS